MAAEATLRVLLLSDLHAFTVSSDLKGKSQHYPSYLEIGEISSEPHLNPFAGLKRLIAEQKILADLVICAGDMADKADPTGVTFVWGNLQSLRSSVGAKLVIATAGNHDVDSRYVYDNSDPLKALKALDPPFPGLSENLCDKFWSKGFAVQSEQEWQVVVLNSCAYHGIGKDPAKEFERGYIRDSTIAELVRSFKGKQRKALNILLCHHHPIRHNEIRGDDYSEMLGGDMLIHALCELDVGPWTVIHGHRHFPRVIYGQGPSTSPVVFSAGSFAARLYPELASRVRNQVYLLEFPIANFGASGVDIAARVFSWDWIQYKGWQRAGSSSGLPATFGFGRRVSFESDSKAILHLLEGFKGRYLNRNELYEQLPWLQFVLPSDVERLVSHLQIKGVRASYDTEGQIDQLGVL